MGERALRGGEGAMWTIVVRDAAYRKRWCTRESDILREASESAVPFHFSRGD